MSGPAARAAARTIRALVAGGVLDRDRDAAAIQRLRALADHIDETAAPSAVSCPSCGVPVLASPDTVGVVRLSRELRAWWQAIRERREAVNQGADLASLFADLDQVDGGAAAPHTRP